jgi:hypothetical protein
MSVAEATAGFERDGYAIVAGLIDPAMTALLAAHGEALLARGELKHGDRAVPGTPFAYGDALFDRVLEQLRPRIEVAVGRRLLPTFSYLRLYKTGDVLKRHRDRPACQFTASLNLSQTSAEPWPLHLIGRTGPLAAVLHPGDALIYLGCELPHWRTAFEGERAAQVFLHYVDADGPHAAEKFDRREALGLRPKPGTGKKLQLRP